MNMPLQVLRDLGGNETILYFYSSVLYYQRENCYMETMTKNCSTPEFGHIKWINLNTSPVLA